MKFNNILSVFTPKDIKFFPLLKELSDIAVISGSLLHELIAHTEKDQRADLCHRIKAEETKGDIISNRISKELNTTFITPFDREDINALADRVEEVLDIINRVAHKILLYNPEHFTKYAVRMAEIIQEGTLEIQAAVVGLEHLKKSDTAVRTHYKKIKLLEETADVVYGEGIVDLFQNEKNTIELIKLKEIIQELEKTANKVNSTGKVIKSIFVKYV